MHDGPFHTVHIRSVIVSLSLRLMCKQPLNVAAWRGANLNYLLWDSVIYNNHI